MKLGKPLSYFLFCFVIPVCAITWFSHTSLNKIDHLQDQLNNNGGIKNTDSIGFYKNTIDIYSREVKILIDSLSGLELVNTHRGNKPVLKIIHDTTYKTNTQYVDKIKHDTMHQTNIEYVNKYIHDTVYKTRIQYVDKYRDRVIHDTVWASKPVNNKNYTGLMEGVNSLVLKTPYMPDTTKRRLMSSIKILFSKYMR